MIDPSCNGVFVSTTGSDSNPGSQAAPVQTIAHALDLALMKGKFVYACTDGEFKESVTLKAGISLFGGLDCKAGWKYVGGTTKTTLTGDTDKPVLTITAPAMSGAGLATVADFKIIAPDSTAAGASSIAVWVDGGSAAFARCDLTAGTGAPGVDGTPLMASPAPAGFDGDIGVAACFPGITHKGPAGKLISCPSADSSAGGNGGDGGAAQMMSSLPAGSNGGDGNPGNAATGKGGIGEDKAKMLSCQRGGDGHAGTDGESGAGATVPGVLSERAYVGTLGASGKFGKPGQGGGGGGGAQSGKADCSSAGGSGGGTEVLGASGGSGGTGGCGGTGGSGGGAGGASIALVSLNASLILTQVTLQAGVGGKGGKGGDGQVGSNGGKGGSFGSGSGLSNSCEGGLGGKGGNGGSGGGGLGGPSIGLAYTGTAPKIDEQQITISKGGQGGLGGAGNMTANGGKGADGIAEKLHAFE